jgi:hypothetical protein
MYVVQIEGVFEINNRRVCKEQYMSKNLAKKDVKDKEVCMKLTRLLTGHYHVIEAFASPGNYRLG